MDEEYIYICKDKSNIQVGDLRIQFSEVKCGPPTIVGQLQSPTFKKYKFPEANPDDDSDRGLCCLSSLICYRLGVLNNSLTEILWIFEKDIVQKEDVFPEEKEKRNNRNIRRVLGWILIWMGLWMFLGPNAYLLNYFPLFESMMKTMGSWTALVFGLIEGGVGSLVMIGCAWISYKPTFGVLLIVLAIGLGIGMLYI